MELVSLRVANWDVGEVEQLCYSASIQVPCKFELLNLLPSHLDNLEYKLKFHTGILSEIDHSIFVVIYRDHHEPKIGVFISIDKHPEKVYEVNMIDASYVTLDQTSIEDSLSKRDPPKELNVLSKPRFAEDYRSNEEFWLSTCGWHDKTNMIFLTFHVVSRSHPKIVNQVEDQMVSREMCAFSGAIQVNHYFLNEDYSDISIKCGNATYFAHRLILSSRVKYFETLLNSNMKECQDKIIKIDDMDPLICKQFLKFIYQGTVDDLSNCAKELYVAADKYDMGDLKGLCERQLFKDLNAQNAIEIYDLSQMHNSPLLAKAAKEIIMWNKDKFASDPETFKNFTCKYPELVFQLFKMT